MEKAPISIFWFVSTLRSGPEETARIMVGEPGRMPGVGTFQASPSSFSSVENSQSAAEIAKRSATTGPVTRKCVSAAHLSPLNSQENPSRIFMPPVKAISPSMAMILRWVRRFA
ncbi:hypothetical protein D3C87_1787100 [compost metagenome]